MLASYKKNILSVLIALIAIFSAGTVRAQSYEPLVMEWVITDVSENKGWIVIGMNPDQHYDFTIDWGDGQSESYYGMGNDKTYRHGYTSTGTFEVKITPNSLNGLPALDMGVSAARAYSDKLKKIKSWGTGQWLSLNVAFSQCKNVDLVATDLPVVVDSISMGGLFANCDSLKGEPLSSWNTLMSKVSDISGMFKGCVNLSGDITGWDVSNVTNMQSVFNANSTFNQDISGWDVGNVSTFTAMFDGATAFNADISGWDTKSAVAMNRMFGGAAAFNRDISGWDMSNVQDIRAMFHLATAFDQNLHDWDISSLQTAEYFLREAKLSSSNYDSLLIGWAAQVEAGTAADTIKFEGGLSMYCSAEAARQTLINKGWGDGITGDQNGVNSHFPADGSDIADGGSDPNCECAAVDDYTTLVSLTGNSIKIPVLDNDNATGATLSILSHGNPPHLGSASLNATGDSIIYTVNGVYAGKDSVQYKITNGVCSSAAWVYIELSSMPHPDWVVENYDCSTDAPVTDFDIQLKQSTDFSVSTFAIPMVGDMDGDGINEIVVPVESRSGQPGYYSNEIYILSGDSLKIKKRFSVPAFGYKAVGLFRQSTGKALIVIAHTRLIGGATADLSSSTSFNTANGNAAQKLTAWDINGDNVWVSDEVYQASGTGFTAPHIGFVDFDSNGRPEIYAFSTVFNQNGQRIVYDAVHTLPSSFYNSVETIMGVGNIDGNAANGIEMAMGGRVVRPNLTNGTLEAVSSYSGQLGHTAVTDIDGDGDLDVVYRVTISNPYNNGSHWGTNDIHVWDGGTNARMAYKRIELNTFGSVNSRYLGAASMPLVGNIAGDAKPEITFILSGDTDGYDPVNHRIQSFRYSNGNLIRIVDIAHTDRSGGTSMSMFDFNNDGILELVYRDESTLRIMNGNNNMATLATIKCGAATTSEYPVIADVDNDGSAEIIVAGGISYSGSSNHVYNEPLHIYENKTPGTWLYARPVWNQYSYTGVNVNKDLSIPQYLINTAIFVDDNNSNPYQPFNAILKQYTWVDANNNPIVLIPDLTISNVTVGGVNPTEDSIYYTLNISNVGDAPFFASDSITLSVYCGSIAQSNIVHRDYINVWIDKEHSAQYQLLMPVSVLEDCAAGELIVRLNDNGRGDFPTDVIQKECNYDNNADTISCMAFATVDSAEVYGVSGYKVSIPILDNDILVNAATGIITTTLEKGSAVLNATNDTVIYTVTTFGSYGLDSMLYKIGTGKCEHMAWIYINVKESTDNDYGDAPDTYGTTLPDGAAHIMSLDLLHFGENAPDGESNGHPSVNADGDDKNGTDDEDALGTSGGDLYSYVTDGYNVALSFKATNNVNSLAYVYGWVDYGKDGNLDLDNRSRATVSASKSNVPVSLRFDISDNSELITRQVDTLYTRLRIGTAETQVSESRGVALDGEVEDHRIRTELLADYGDLPASYNTTMYADGGAYHLVKGSSSTSTTSSLMLGDSVGVEQDGDETSALADKDSYDDGAYDLANSVYLNTVPAYSLGSSRYSVTFYVNKDAGIKVDAKAIAWLDTSNNQQFESSEAVELTVNASGAYTFVWNNMPSLSVEQIALRVRASTDVRLTASRPNGVLVDGEVEDYMVEVSCAGVAKNYYATISDGLPITVYPLDSVHFSPVTLDSIKQPNNGVAVLHADDSVTYTPERGFVGADSIKYYITANGLCVDSAWIIITIDCLPHKIPDMAMEVCLDSYTGNINFVEYMPYAGLTNVSVWDDKGNLVSSPTSYPVSGLKKGNTTVFTYYYEKAGFCVGSVPANIYINAIDDNRTAIFDDKTLSLCGATLREGGYPLSSMMSYVSDGGAWGTATATGTSVNPNGYISGGVFDAQSFWNAVIAANGNAAPDKVSVTIPYTTGANDNCAGASETANLTIVITKE
ncbi:MAG: BspA family leucine-rich repeat surface protein [Bacteroidales bacterium]